MNDHAAQPNSMEPDAEEIPQSQETPQSLWRELAPTDLTDPVAHEAHKSEESPHWLLFGASRRGRSHAHAGTYREDAFAFAGIPSCGSNAWVIAVADGAGSCRLSRVGANIAVEQVIKSVWQGRLTSDDATAALHLPLKIVLTELIREARRRECDLHDLACTLLVLAWKPAEDGAGGTAFTFQAGDGLIAAIRDTGVITPLAEQDAEAFAGTTHFFTGDHVQKTLMARFRSVRYEAPPEGFLVMTDGVADDLTPLAVNGPIIVNEIRKLRDGPVPGEGLLELLAYEKRGSFDDRTLVAAMNRQWPAPVRASEPLETGAGEDRSMWPWAQVREGRRGGPIAGRADSRSSP